MATSDFDEAFGAIQSAHPDVLEGMDEYGSGMVTLYIGSTASPDAIKSALGALTPAADEHGIDLSFEMQERFDDGDLKPEEIMDSLADFGFNYTGDGTFARSPNNTSPKP